MLWHNSPMDPVAITILDESNGVMPLSGLITSLGIGAVRSAAGRTSGDVRDFRRERRSAEGLK